MEKFSAYLDKSGAHLLKWACKKSAAFQLSANRTSYETTAIYFYKRLLFLVFKATEVDSFTALSIIGVEVLHYQLGLALHGKQTPVFFRLLRIR